MRLNIALAAALSMTQAVQVGKKYKRNFDFDDDDIAFWNYF